MLNTVNFLVISLCSSQSYGALFVLKDVLLLGLVFTLLCIQTSLPSFLQQPLICLVNVIYCFQSLQFSSLSSSFTSSFLSLLISLSPNSFSPVYGYYCQPQRAGLHCHRGWKRRFTDDCNLMPNKLILSSIWMKRKYDYLRFYSFVLNHTKLNILGNICLSLS